MNNSEQLLIEVLARTDRANAQLQAIETRLTGMGNTGAQATGKIGNGFTQLTSIVSRFAGPVALGFAVKKLYDFTTAAVDAADNIKDTSDQLGITTDAYQELAYAATLSGSSASGLEAAMRRLNVRAGEAVDGSDEARDAFSRLGISVQEVATSSPDQLFAKIADGIAKLDSPATRAAAAVKIFGKEGAKLVPMLSQGATEIDRLRDAAQKSGAVINENLINKAAEAKDKWDAAKMVLSATATSLMVELAPAITAVITALASAASAVNQFFDRFRDPKNMSNALGEIDRLEAKIKKFDDAIARSSGRRSRGPSLESQRQQYIDRRDAIQAELDAQAEKAQADAVALVAGEAAIKQSEREKKAVEDLVTAKQKAADEALALAQAAYEEDKNRIERLNDLTKTTAEKQAEAFVEAFAGLDELLERGVINAETYADRLHELFVKDNPIDLDAIIGDIPEITIEESPFDKLLKNWENSAERIQDVFGEMTGDTADALAELATGGSVDAENLAKSWIKAILKIQIQALLLKALTGTSLGSAIGSAFGLGKAGGGSVQPGTVYPVGERGPELFVPSTAGRIVPNHMTGSGGGSQPANVTIINNGTPQKVDSVRPTQTGQDAGVQILLSDLNKGGPISKAFENTYGVRRRAR